MTGIWLSNVGAHWILITLDEDLLNHLYLPSLVKVWQILFFALYSSGGQSFKIHAIYSWPCARGFKWRMQISLLCTLDEATCEARKLALSTTLRQEGKYGNITTRPRLLNTMLLWSHCSRHYTADELTNFRLERLFPGAAVAVRTDDIKIGKFV